jgi:hypothetical protein
MFAGVPPLPRPARVATGALAVLAAVAAAGARSEVRAQPLWQAEVRAGYGLAVGGRGTQMSRRATPLTLAAIAAYAFSAAPPLAGYGGLLIETLDRNAVGATFGVQLTPTGSRLRLSAGGATLVAPYTLWGATASAGACMRATARTAICGDAQLTAYVAGSDLADDHTVTQGQLVVGLVFDAL